MTVYRLVHSGELPAVRFGRSFRIPESAVTSMLFGQHGHDEMNQVG
jgi:excisionase family DNA binding protein